MSSRDERKEKFIDGCEQLDNTDLTHLEIKIKVKRAWRHTRRQRRPLASFPPGLAVTHFVVSMGMLAVTPPPPTTPALLLLINYVLSLYTAAWLWLVLNRQIGRRIARSA